MGKDVVKAIFGVVIALVSYVFINGLAELRAEDDHLRKRIMVLEERVTTKDDAVEIKNAIVSLGDQICDIQKDIGTIKLAMVRHDKNIQLGSAAYVVYPNK